MLRYSGQEECTGSGLPLLPPASLLQGVALPSTRCCESREEPWVHASRGQAHKTDMAPPMELRVLGERVLQTTQNSIVGDTQWIMPELCERGGTQLGEHVERGRASR